MTNENEDPNLIPGTQVEGQLVGDPDPRIGVGIASLPLSDPLTPCAAAHDAEFILKHQGKNMLTRTEADARLRRCMVLLAQHEIYPEHGSGFAEAWERMRAEVLSELASLLGGFFWNSNNQDRQEEHREESFVEGMLEAADPRYREVEGFENPYQDEHQEVWTDSHSVKIDQEKLKELAENWAKAETKPEPSKPEEPRDDYLDALNHGILHGNLDSWEPK